jgi:hypothetical protein
MIFRYRSGRRQDDVGTNLPRGLELGGYGRILQTAKENPEIGGETGKSGNLES